MILGQAEEIGKYTIGIFWEEYPCEDPREGWDMVGTWEEISANRHDELSEILAYKLIEIPYYPPKGWIRKAKKDPDGWHEGYDYDTCSQVVQDWLDAELARLYVVNEVGYLHQQSRERTVNFCALTKGHEEWPKLRGKALRQKILEHLEAEEKTVRAWAHGEVFGWAVVLTEDTATERGDIVLEKHGEIIESCGAFYGFGEWQYMLTEARGAAERLIEKDKEDQETAVEQARYDAGNGD